MEKRYAFDSGQYFTVDKIFSVINSSTCFILQHNFPFLVAFPFLGCLHITTAALNRLIDTFHIIHGSRLISDMAWWASVSNSTLFNKWVILSPIHNKEHTVSWFCSSIKYCQCITWFFIFRLLKIHWLVWLFRTFASTLLEKLFSVPHFKQ